MHHIMYYIDFRCKSICCRSIGMRTRYVALARSSSSCSSQANESFFWSLLRLRWFELRSFRPGRWRWYLVGRWLRNRGLAKGSLWLGFPKVGSFRARTWWVWFLSRKRKRWRCWCRYICSWLRRFQYPHLITFECHSLQFQVCSPIW